MTKLLAVYGTLKKGYYNHEIHLKGLTTQFEGFLTLPFQLFTNGRYPMIIKSKDMSKIYFEIYEVSENTFSDIIKLEEPFGYHYEKIEITDLNDFAEVFVFTKGKPPSEFILVENGNWENTMPW